VGQAFFSGQCELIGTEYRRDDNDHDLRNDPIFRREGESDPFIDQGENEEEDSPAQTECTPSPIGNGEDVAEDIFEEWFPSPD